MIWDASVLVVGLAAVVAFAVAFHISGLIARVRVAVTVTHTALAVLSDKTLDDAAKERELRRGALRLIGESYRVALVAAFVLGAPGAVVWIGHLIGLAPFAAVSAVLLSWEVIVGATVIVFVWWIMSR